MGMRSCLLLLSAFAAFVALRCSWDAPRDNPLDPMIGGNVSGRVLTRRASPIVGARVSIPCAGRLIETDSAGVFDLRGLPEESAWVFITADLYAADSARVALAKGEIRTINAYLNGLPFLQNCRVATHVYGRGWPPDPLQFSTLSATAGDADGTADIDSVWVEIPDMGYSQGLSYDPEERAFVKTLWTKDLPGQSLNALAGQAIRFNVADIESTVATVTVIGITRIITDLPQPSFPIGGVDTLADDTTFLWRRFDRGYAVRYRAEVVRVLSGSPAGVAAEFETADTTWRFAASLLDSGEYYWTVEAIDEFGNSSRSAEELFYAR